MIDIHCHILPGVDDGPAGIRESIEMCRMAAADGIETIVASPHFSPGSIEWTAKEMAERVGRLETALREEGIQIRILPGADVSVFPELTEHPGRRGFLSINNGRYLLVEFPFAAMPPNWDFFLQALLRAGVTPVITHPERNAWFIRHPEAVYWAVEQGALVQITGMSILGGFGEEAKDYCELLLEHRLAHVIATDGHSIAERPPVLSEAVRAASALIGEERAGELVRAIPAAIIEGRPMRLPEPLEPLPKKRTWFTKIFRSG